MKKALTTIAISIAQVVVIMAIIIFLAPDSNQSHPYLEVLSEENENGWRVKISQLTSHNEQQFIPRDLLESEYLIEVFRDHDIRAKASLRKKNLIRTEDDIIEVRWVQDGFSIWVNQSPEVKFKNETYNKIMFFEMN